MSMMKEKVEELEQRRQKVLEMGGAEKVKRQHDSGKLTVRERLDLLFDEGTFVEIGLHAQHQSSSPQMAGKETPADGVVTGYGQVDGRMACVIAYDFTVMAGSMGQIGEYKASQMRQMAVEKRIPLIWLLDSAGARIQEATGSQFAGTGHLFFEESIMSGSIPMVAAMMGPCAAGTAYIPGLADFVPMVKGTSSMALGGSHLVKAAIGEEISVEELGGSKVHCRVSGVGDLEVKDDPACLEAVRKYLSFFPPSCDEPPPRIENDDPLDRREEALLEILPDNPRSFYDMKKVIRLLVDKGDFFEIKPAFARNLVIGLARLGGDSVGIVASQPKNKGGILDNDAADKAARFISLCDAFEIPLVFLVDVPGFMVGSRVEQAGIIRHGAKMIHALSSATVPKLTVVLRKAYGAGYYAMCGRAYEPDLLVAWPTAEISVMGPEGAVNIIFRKAIESSSDPDDTRQQLIAGFKELIAPHVAAGWGFIDDVIDPRATRPLLIQGLRLARNKKVIRYPRKHGVSPV